MTKLSIRLDESFSGHPQKKFICPSCQKKRFVKFYNFEKNEYLPDEYGRCDRSENCGYYLAPYGSDEVKTKPEKPHFIPAPLKIKYVDKSIVAKTLDRYDDNNFAQYLFGLIGKKEAIKLFYRFYVGTAKGRGSIFWQVDNFMQIRTGQLVFYKTDGHRDKTNPPFRLFKTEDDYHSCLFGLHQLFTMPENLPVAIVESEKTAIMASVYLPELFGRKVIWMACSGSNGLTAERIAPLAGREIILVPDFSFHARATWGALPMRKKPETYIDKAGIERTKIIISPDGELTEYNSAKDRFISISCDVKFFDPYPEINDGSDIADTFVKPVEILISVPDFEKLEIKSEIKPVDRLKKVDRSNVPSGLFSFNLAGELGQKKEIRANNLITENYLTEYLKNDKLQMLINQFDLAGSCLAEIG